MDAILYRYKGFQGNNSEDIFQASGAYIFRPDGDIPTPMAIPINVTVVKVTKIYISII